MGANDPVNYPYHETRFSINSDLEGNKYKATFDQNPFNQGASRYAFTGILDGKGPRKGEKCVTKVFKKDFARNFDQWIPDLSAIKMSLKFAEKFNADCIPKLMSTRKNIEFLIPLMATVYDVAHDKRFLFFRTKRDQSLVRIDQWVSIEPYLEEKYTKFNSNSGYEDAIHGLMPTFSHWTFSISDHQFMVCDLQGIEEDDKFILTDPAVHSWGKKYGMTDLGVVGMEMVLANHNCNSFCSQLGLINPVEDQRGMIQSRIRRNTFYSFQLSKAEERRALNMQTTYF